MSSPVNAVVPSQNPANAHSYRIIVCLTWRKELVQMIYPDERPEWVYREDCGSYSQFRWSLRCKNNKDIVQLVVKHNTCLNSLFMQPYCVNCQMRETWHQPCTTPEDVFYALVIQPTNICNDAVLPLVQHSYSVNSATIAAYLAHMPRAKYSLTKSPKNNDRTKKRMLELKAKIKARVYELNLKADADAAKSMQQQEQIAFDSLQSINVTDPLTLLSLGCMATDMSELLNTCELLGEVDCS